MNGCIHTEQQRERERERTALCLTVSCTPPGTFHQLSDVLQSCECDLDSSRFFLKCSSYSSWFLQRPVIRSTALIEPSPSSQTQSSKS